jgi:hypothetical protein
MEEIFDQLLTKIMFSVLLIIMLIAYRFLHLLLYPHAKKQVMNLYSPFENLPDTIHYYARIIGICIVFTSFEVHLFDNLYMGVFHLVFWILVDIVFYLLALYILELVILHAFQYQQEILKRRNLCYAIINATIALCLAVLIRNIVTIADYSIPFMIILWLFMVVVFGLLAKQYHLVSRFSFSKSVFSQDVGVVFSYVGFLISTTLIVYYSFSQTQKSVGNFIISTLTHLLLCGILLPLFFYGIQKVFLMTQKMTIPIYQQEKNLQYGVGLTEAMLYLSAALLTVIVVFGANLYSVSL